MIGNVFEYLGEEKRLLGRKSRFAPLNLQNRPQNTSTFSTWPRPYMILLVNVNLDRSNDIWLVKIIWELLYVAANVKSYVWPVWHAFYYFSHSAGRCCEESCVFSSNVTVCREEQDCAFSANCRYPLLLYIMLGAGVGVHRRYPLLLIAIEGEGVHGYCAF